MYEYEKNCIKQGFSYIAGLDEAGRGPLAGPVVAAAVVFPLKYQNSLINDSKKLSKKKRELLFDIIKKECIDYSIIEISPETIDNINILNATKTAMLKCIDTLNKKPDFLLTDHVNLNTDIPQENIIKGDSKSISIAAASILAKVHRDKIMEDLAKQYPEYGFESHAGYGTKKHLEALEKYGATPIHRKSFSPVRKVISEQSLF